MQFKVKKNSRGPLFTGGNQNGIKTQIQMQEYKSIFEKLVS